MKGKNTSSKLITKTDLGQALKDVAKKDDLKNFATKDDLHALEIRTDIKMEDMERRIDDNAQKYRDTILTRLDGVMGELETMREENTIGAYQTREIQVKVDGHEKRIAKLEKTQQT